MDIPPFHSQTVSISHHPSGSPFPDKLNNLRAEAPENTYTCSANGLPTLSWASWSNRTTTARLLSNAFSHTPSQWSLPTAFYIEALERSWCLPCLGRETGLSLRTRPKPAEYVQLMDASLEHMESSIMIIRRSPVTLKKQYPWSWERHWIIQHVPNYCRFLFSLSMNVCVSVCVLLLGCCNVLELCTSVQMEKLFQLGAVRPAGLCPLHPGLARLCSVKLRTKRRKSPFIPLYLSKTQANCGSYADEWFKDAATCMIFFFFVVVLFL